MPAKIGSSLDIAADFLQRGHLVGLPTETVYGLAGNGLDPQAVARIFTAKNRPAFDPLILHSHSVDAIAKFAGPIPVEMLPLLRFWPGPMTLLLPRRHNVPDLVTAGLETVAVRIPRHPMALELLTKLDFPLAAPSANPFGYISPTTPDHVLAQLGERVSYVLDGGPCEVGLESTILGLEEGKLVVLRLGGLPVERIRKETYQPIRVRTSSSMPNAPGMLQKHYAPRTPVSLYDAAEDELPIFRPNTYFLAWSQAPKGWPDENVFRLSIFDDPDEAAQRFFSVLREIDALEGKHLYAEMAPDVDLGRAINDRLRRAAVR